MPALDVFDADAFSFVSLTKAVNMMGYVPDFLETIPDLFEEVPIRTTEVWIERRGYQAALIQTTARGSEPSQVGSDKRDARAFNTTRIAQASKVFSYELQNIRRFGSEIDVKDAMEEIGRRIFKLNSNINLTEEYHRLNLVTQGKMLDTDGSTIYDWTSEFASQPLGARALSPISSTAFAFSTHTTNDGAIRKACNSIVRSILRNLSAGNIPTSRVKIVALCGDSFYDQLTTSPEVEATFLNWNAAADLRSSVGEVFQPFSYAGVNFVNYRGTDDNSTVAVGSTNAKFFPTGAGIFQVARAPGEKMEMVGTPGQKRYAEVIRDMQRDRWVEAEVSTYPLYVCTLPQAIAAGTA
jgi:hypothetical protein